MIKLVISDNEGSTTVVPLVRDEVSIGRKEGNTIRLTERNISREHCRLQRHNGSYLLRDLSSYNGVLLNGQRVVGESPVKAGDELRIGDYTLQLELEARGAADDTEGDPTLLAPIPRPSSPARLVVLTPPLAGAEFSLPERGELRLGRAPELDVTIDHRSVSREHAKIVSDGEQARIIDQGSINGVVVNREKVSEARLAPGDVIELGDVLLRFVGPGEHYMFDPAQVRSLIPQKRGRRPQLVALGIVVGAVALALAIVRSGQKPTVHDAVPTVQKASASARPEQGARPAEVMPAAAEPDHFEELLTACREANDGGRYAEAVAHANAALKGRPDAPDALACQQTARVNHEQEQIYVRGRAALEAGDVDGAWRELSSLNGQSAVRQRPDVEAALLAAARLRLGQAQGLLRKKPEQAGELAGSVLWAQAVPEEIRAQAQSLVDRAAAARPAKAAKTETPPRVAAVDHQKVAQAPHPAPVPHASGSEKSAMDTASACLARGDNACVIRTLGGRAQTAQELGLLIETYRAMGDSTQAYRNMAVYVQRFPSARRAEAYRQQLERQGH